MPRNAYRKLRAAKSLVQTLYIYGATGFGKTAFVQKTLEKRSHVYLSCGNWRWDERDVPERGTVVLDDLHLLDEPRRELVKRLAADPEIWLILINRSPVPSWLMPEYVNIGFIVISEKDMRLGKKEIQGYLDSLGLSYTKEGLQYLADTAEGNGYIVRHAALRMAEGLSPGPKMYQEIHDAFARYLEEYIMVQWDSELLEFLMEVSVVEEFTLPLAELITANRLASVMVQKAMETGNFLFENDGMYRLRPVLLHALRKKAQQSLGEEQIKNCRKSAGVWYEMDGQISQALEMYEQSGSQGQIRELLIRNARVNPGAGHYYELRRYYLGMDEEEAAKSPVLMAGLSMLHSMLMDPKKSEYWYEKLSEFAKTAQGGAKREAKSRLCYLDIGLPHRGSRDVLKIMLRAPAMLLDQGISLPEFSVTSNIPSTMNGGKDFCKWSRSDRALARTVGPLVERVLGSYGKGLTKIALGESLYEKGADAFEVLTLLSRGQVETECGGRLEIAFSAVGQRVRLMILQGDLKNAGTILGSFQSAVEEQRVVQLMPNIQAMRCRIALYAGDIETVNQWLSTAPDEDKEFITMERYRYFTKARCYLTLGENLKALALLEKLSEYAKLVHRTYVGIEAGLLVAIVRRRLGTEWEPQLKVALDEAESYQFVRVITELGPAILPLLKARSRASPWFNKVLEETQQTARRYPGYLSPRNAVREDFSSTALEILHLQSEGLSATLIAGRLGMKADNVRYHIKENYRKLGASGKAEAIAAARGLGLI
ncbi:LuxR family transcriptional regulator [Acutalibacter muris]|uniref:LuxR family transcriptional regulator n=1 Tax=Acutalibacter muris TaxID=1796620 RepID=A0A1Z2XWM1_9FIRM|nr:LuxR C-terminal-related transcriptional regulator [Acutalibacter muris]ANU56050.1 LuxR family transcriptional regulator [Hungateiclostridiaceae bacterium KB18]ASB42832.1 LuxR family transcriptional regulator [Acutalibacter muris]QQR31828.1 LuxR family transcriptional regulator [Acutalibacter muris]